MSFTNINDPAGVKALLDQLRVSQAWQEVTSPSTQNEETPSRTSDEQPAGSSVATSTSVASLLSQLHSLPPLLPPPLSRDEDSSHKAQPVPRRHEPTPSAAPVPPRVQTDTRSYTFQQALPYLGQLAEDPDFVDVIKQMKKDQDDLERQLCEDRCAIHKKYEDKVKIAVTKANMTGDGKLSKHEADMIQATFKRELEKFDRDRALIAWDGLISKQQTALASHNVPTMFVSTQGAARDRQQRVMQVLENIISS